jgi:hypothetical protein
MPQTLSPGFKKLLREPAYCQLATLIQRAGAGGGSLSVVPFSWVRASRPGPKGPWSSGYGPLFTNVLERLSGK